MTIAALLFMYESWRAPRRIQHTDTIRNALVVINGVAVAGIQWRSSR